MSDEIRSNAQEFLSFLGTCMYFYEHNLTPYEQSHVMTDVGTMLRDYLAPKNREKLILVLRGKKFSEVIDQMYVDTDSVNAVREAYHTGQTHAVMRGGETNGKDDI